MDLGLSAFDRAFAAPGLQQAFESVEGDIGERWRNGAALSEVNDYAK